MSNREFVEMKVPAKVEYVGVIRLSLSGIANRMGFSYADIEDLKIAVSEAITNAITHAYETNEIGEIQIKFSIYEDRLEIMVTDYGESFEMQDIKEKIGPVKDAEKVEDLREGGFGLFLMEALMDRVQINSSHSGVCVLMTKYLDKLGVDKDDDQVSSR